MQIVIDIDEESYEHIKKYANEEVLPIGWYAIINGTPLPERHGRLIDVDELHHKMGEWLKPQKADETVMVALDDIAISTMMEIEEAPTIIEGSESK